MRLKILIIFCILSIGLNAQVRQGVRQRNDAKGFIFKEQQIDSLIRFPRDTLALLPKDSGSYAYKGGKTWIFNGYRWDSLIGSGTDSSTIFIDTSGLRYQSNILRNSKPYNVLRSFASFRALPSIDTTPIWRTSINGLVRDYIYDPTDVSSADDSVTVIIVGTKRFKLYFENYVLANWFEIKPDDGIDDSYGMQKAINFAIRNLKTPFVKVLGGTYDLKNVVIYKKSGAEYAFVNMTIEGVSRNHGSGIGGGGTVFRTNALDGFTLGVQAARHVNINNIAFQGPVAILADQAALINATESTWTSSGTIRDNRYSPVAAIPIDPFHVSVGGGNQYPGMSSWYTNTTNSGSAMINIDGCDIRNYIAGVIISPNGVTQSGENIIFENGSEYNNKSFWVSCQPQTRGNIINNLDTYGNTETLINCNDYGYQQGSAPEVIYSDIAGGTKYLHRYNGPFAGITYTGCYMEAVWSIGQGGELATELKDCKISYMVPDNFTNIRPSPVLYQGDRLVISGGNQQWVDAYFAMGFVFDVKDLSVNSTTFVGGAPFKSNIYYKDRYNANDVKFKNVAGTNTISDDITTTNVALANINALPVFPGMKFETELTKEKHEVVGHKLDNIIMESAAIRIYSTPLGGLYGNGYFISSNSARWQVGDLIATNNQSINYSNDVYSAADGQIGFVSSKSVDTVKLKYITAGIADSTSYNLYLMRVPHFIGRTFGNTVNTSVYITGCTYNQASQTFHAGDYIKGKGIPKGARVAFAHTDTIILTVAATATVTTNQLYDAEVKMTITNEPIYDNGNSHLVDNFPVFAGDMWLNNTPAAIDAYGGYVATAGWINEVGARPATTFGTIKAQDNTNHAFTNAANIFTTGINQFTNNGFWVGYQRSNYAATGVHFTRSADQNGYNKIQSFGQLGQYNDYRDYGNLSINEGGGTVGIGQAPTGQPLSVNGAIASSGLIAYSYPTVTPTQTYALLGYYSPGPFGYIQCYDPVNGIYYPFQIEGRVVSIKPKGSTTGGAYADSSGFYANNNLYANNGTVYSINGQFTGGIVNQQSDVNSYSWFADGNGSTGGKFKQRGKAEFLDSLKLTLYRNTGLSYNRVALIKPDGNLDVSGPAYKSPDLYPVSITSGSSSTPSLQAGYVGISIYFNPTSTIGTYTLTMPSSPADNDIVKIHAGGTITSGNSVVTSFTLSAGSYNFKQVSVPTILYSGDELTYRFYNNYWYREGELTKSDVQAITNSFASQTLTDGATVTWTLSAGINADLTIGGNRTLAISGAVAGSYGTLVITQDGTGSRTIALPAGSKVVNGGSGVITLSTPAASIDIINFYYNGTNYFWTYGKNFN